MEQGAYKAKSHYQSAEIASEYDDERFNSWHGRATHRTESEALETAAKLYFREPGTLLDIPCGTGRLFPVLLSRGLKITGGDISAQMIEVAQKKYGANQHVNFRQVNAEKLDFEDNTFDYLTSYRLMCHLPPEIEKRVLNEMIRVTKKILIINYHFACLSPLYLFNSIFRKQFCPVRLLKPKELAEQIKLRSDVELVAIKKLSWYERSSALVILRKK